MPVVKVFKDFAKASNDKIFLIPVNKLIDNPNNQRTDFGDITSLAKDIVQNGLKQPLLILRAKRTDDKAVISDGHRRIRGIRYAIDKLGAPIKDVACKFEPEGTNEEDRYYNQFSTAANAKDLTDLEKACIIKRLLDMNQSYKDIATRTNMKQTAIKSLLELHAAPIAIREKVKAKEMSRTAAVALSKAPKEKQDAVLADAGKGKVDVKDVEKATKGVTSQISSHSIKMKLAKARKILDTTQEPKYWDGVVFGMEVCIGLKDLPPQE